MQEANMQEPKTITIDPEQALGLLDQAVATITTNRQGHEVLATCLQVLRQRIVNDQERILTLEDLVSKPCIHESPEPLKIVPAPAGGQQSASDAVS